MEDIKTAIDLLDAVFATMNTIPVVGIENQDKFVGCANAIRTVSQTLDGFLRASKETTEKEVTDGR